jgi:hypothetical protein
VSVGIIQLESLRQAKKRQGTKEYIGDSKCAGIDLVQCTERPERRQATLPRSWSDASTLLQEKGGRETRLTVHVHRRDLAELPRASQGRCCSRRIFISYQSAPLRGKSSARANVKERCPEIVLLQPVVVRIVGA